MSMVGRYNFLDIDHLAQCLLSPRSHPSPSQTLELILRCFLLLLAINHHYSQLDNLKFDCPRGQNPKSLPYEHLKKRCVSVSDNIVSNNREKLLRNHSSTRSYREPKKRPRGLTSFLWLIRCQEGKYYEAHPLSSLETQSRITSKLRDPLPGTCCSFPRPPRNT